MILNIKYWILIASMFILCLLACQQDDLPLIESYQLCTSEFIYVDTARASQNELTAREIPQSISEFVAAQFPGTFITAAKIFQTKNGQIFREVKLDNVGYALFDNTHTYQCVIERYPTIVIDNTIDEPQDTTPTSMEDDLIDISETGSCDANMISFKYQVHPILVSNCAQSGCHNSKDREDGIDVETYEQVIREVRAGDASRSEHYKSITRNPDHKKFMPEKPRDPLLVTEIKIIEDWINQGAENTDCQVPCNSTATSFKDNIQPLFKTYCYGCHQAGDKEGGISMEDYGLIKELVDDGSLLGSMKHSPNFVAMPLYLDKMTDCQIGQVENWIKEGAKNN
ncbi:MAG: cytochrome c [Saprospiraceae bacterium]